MIRWILGLTLVVLVVGETESHAMAGPIVDSVNANATPFDITWGATAVGWYYTPSFSYDLTSVLTKFGALVDNRVITEVIYDTNTPSDGGTLLASATFSPLPDAFAGGSFAPISLTAGHRYFVGFENTGDLGTVALSENVTKDAGATYLSDLRWTQPGAPDFGSTESGFYTGQPILEFVSSSPDNSTPEPSTFTLLGIGIIGMAGYGWRRRKKKALPG